MTTRQLSTSSISALLLVIGGCELAGGPCLDSCCGGDPGSRIHEVRLTYCELEVQALDNSGDHPVVSENASVPRAAIGLRMGLQSREEVCGWPKFDFSFATAVYACSPVIDFNFVSLDSIEQLTVRTVNDFSLDYPAGSDITSEVRVLRDTELVSITDYLTSVVNPDSLLRDIEFSEVSMQAIDLVLTTSPTIGDRHQFRIMAPLSDGRVLEALSPEITVY